MASIENISSFIQDFTGIKSVGPDVDINHDLGVAGDDFHAMIKMYKSKYDVDMSSYLWYFHCEEEGQNTFGFLFKPPHQLVERIPVTPKMLAKFSETKVWSITYPAHKLPKRRWDLIFNGTMVFLIVLYMVYYYVFK